MTERTAAPGPLLARGRSADVFDVGGGRVLRRRRDGPIPDHEPLAMRLAADHGFPVPTVHDVDGSDMLLDRVDGIDMLTDLGRRPWLARRHAGTLGELHLGLRRVVPGDTAIRGEPPREALVHGDLHPGNVLLTADGPVVIDWEGASIGPRDADVATAWLLMTIARPAPDEVPAAIRPLVGVIQGVLRRRFLAVTGRPCAATVDRVCAVRLVDRNMRSGERERIRAFHRRYGSGGSAAGST